MPLVKVLAKVTPSGGRDRHFRSIFSSSSLSSGLQLTDLHFRFGSSSTEICAHQARFASVSPFLNSIFRQRFVVLSDGLQRDPEVTVVLDPIFAEPLKVLIELLYCGRSSVTDIGAQDPELLNLCRILGIELLKLESELLNSDSSFTDSSSDNEDENDDEDEIEIRNDNDEIKFLNDDDGKDFNDKIELLNDDGKDFSDEIELRNDDGKDEIEVRNDLKAEIEVLKDDVNKGGGLRKRKKIDEDENKSGKKVQIRWSCSECSASFCRLESLEAHEKKCQSLRIKDKKGCSDDDEFDDKSRCCKKCGRIFKYRIALRKHFLTCNGIEDSPEGGGEVCPVCSRRFSNLKIHVYKHFVKELEDLLSKKGISLTSKECEICKRGFTRRSDLLQHYSFKHGMIEKVMKTTKPQEKEEEKEQGTSVVLPPEAEGDAKNVVDCCRCPLKFCDKEDLKNHLTNHHFKKEILAMIDERKLIVDGGKCAICKSKSCEVSHFAIDHKLLKTFLPAEFAEYLFDEEVGKCEYCECQDISTIKSYKIHLITHFQNQIRRDIRKRLYSLKRCDFCNRDFECNQVAVIHYGIKHQLLAPLLNESLAERLFANQQSEFLFYECDICRRLYTSRNGIQFHIIHHFKSQLAEQIKEKTTTPGVCFICNIHLTEKSFMRHIAIIHKFVEPYLSENMAKLVFCKEKPPPTVAPLTPTSSCNQEEEVNTLNCVYCEDKKAAIKLSDLRIHLAEVHFREKLELEIEKRGWDLDSCHTCQLSLSTKTAMFHHYAFVHLLKDLLLPKDYGEKVFPSDNNALILEPITCSDPELVKELNGGEIVFEDVIPASEDIKDDLTSQNNDPLWVGENR